MTALLLRKHGQGLFPSDPRSDEYVAEIGQGKDIMAKPWFPRHPRFHRLAMSYIGNAFENQEEYDDREDFEHWLKLACGLFTTFVGHGGETVYRLEGSWAWDSMDEIHFRRFMRRVEYIVARDFIPGLTLDEYKKAFDMETTRRALMYETPREKS